MGIKGDNFIKFSGEIMNVFLGKEFFFWRIKGINFLFLEFVNSWIGEEVCF